MSEAERRLKIATLNDEFRKEPSKLGILVVSDRLHEMGPAYVQCALAKIRASNSFAPQFDAGGEHACGAIELDGVEIVWRIDCYQKGWNLKLGANTPEQPDDTDRVLTVLLASEY